MISCDYILPPWLAGRYNEKGHCAILYNNLDGNCFFFDEDSADVIGTLLDYDRGEEIDINIFIERNNIDETSIIEFFEELALKNLLINKYTQKPNVKENTANILSDRDANKSDSYKKNNPFYFDNVEDDYRIIIEEQSIPMSIMLEITYNCNEKCIHCYNQGAARGNGEEPNRNTQELNIQDYKILLDKLAEREMVKLSLTCGEPLLKKEFWQILEYAFDKKFAVDIYTNGLILFIKNEVGRLLSFYPRSVGLSIYSSIPEVHDSITRIKGSLAKTLSVAEEISNAGIPLYFKCPIMTINAKSYHTVADLASKYNAVYQFDVNIAAGNDGDKAAPNHLRLNSQTMNLVLRDSLQPLYVGKDAPNMGKKNLEINSSLCGAGINIANITPFGEVYPCNAFPMPCGNIKTDTFFNIWHYSESLKSVRQVVYHNTEQCGTNPRCHYCNRCIGQSYIETQNLTKNSTDNCFIANVRKEISDDIEYMAGEINIIVKEEIEKLEFEGNIDFNKEY